MADHQGFGRRPWHLSPCRGAEPQRLGFRHRTLPSPGWLYRRLLLSSSLLGWLIIRLASSWLRLARLGRRAAVVLARTARHLPRATSTPSSAPILAVIHGCFAQLVFALLVSVAVMSPRAAGRSSHDSAPKSPASAALIAGTDVLVSSRNCFWCACVRHTARPWSTAAASAAGVRRRRLRSSGCLHECRRCRQCSRQLGASILVARCVLVCIAADARRRSVAGKFAVSAPASAQNSAIAPWTAVLASGHVLVGTFIFAATVVLAVACAIGTVSRPRCRQPCPEVAAASWSVSYEG